MSTGNYFPSNIVNPSKAMMFIDGENLAIRFKEVIRGKKPEDHVRYLEDVYVWSDYANVKEHTKCDLVRKYYYTIVQGDGDRLIEVEKSLKEIGVETPRVFKKNKNRPTKRVDITLATDMLTHAHRKNMDIAVLVAGDDDYVPLVRAVKEEGIRVVLWFFEDSEGLSEPLKLECDYFFDINHFLTHTTERTISNVSAQLTPSRN